ncbi:MAG: hypothetical protein E7C49_00925 [Clostridium sp.]|nr:hypothetical protein [Clostridium sp.]
MKLDKLILKNNTLIFEQNAIELEKESELLIVIQNVKTKEEFICEYLITTNNIVVLLDSLFNLFTNYEGSIQILRKNNDKYYLYTPILNCKPTIDSQKDVNSQYRWFVRVLENGEIRLSSIMKK